MYAGKIIAPGIAFGPALIWAPAHAPVAKTEIAPAAVPAELARFHHACQRARRELLEVALRVRTTFGESAAAIFSAHAAFLEDPSFLEPITRRISQERMTAESAAYAAVEDLIGRLAAMPNKYLAARIEDLGDLRQRLITHLRQEGGRGAPKFSGPCILVADNFAAADVIGLDRTHLLGLVLTHSGTTSHAAMLAATLGVPVVAGVPQLLGQVHDGDTIIIDGNHGQVLVNPKPLALREYRTRREIFERFSGELATLRGVPAVTPDGRHVRLTANVGLAEEVPYALSQGAQGIGLLRTEYFYLSRGRAPTEEEQHAFYAGVVQAMAPNPVTFRAFDLGGDKTATPVAAEANPMLGCRGIRLLLEQRDLFRGQLRALLRASALGPVRIMFPLITGLTEFQETMGVVRQVQEELRAARVPFDERIPYGIMVETPSAAIIADILATEVEFFSIGSNDLIQYTVAADRTNPRVTGLYEPLHLAVLRMMQHILQAAAAQGRSVSLCGEMAADPIYTIILLGLGVDELSMNPVMIPAVKQVIRSVTWAEAQGIARDVLRERRARDVQSYLERTMARRFPQMMSLYGHGAATSEASGEPTAG